MKDAKTHNGLFKVGGSRGWDHCLAWAEDTSWTHTCDTPGEGANENTSSGMVSKKKCEELYWGSHILAKEGEMLPLQESGNRQCLRLV